MMCDLKDQYNDIALLTREVIAAEMFYGQKSSKKLIIEKVKEILEGDYHEKDVVLRYTLRDEPNLPSLISRARCVWEKAKQLEEGGRNRIWMLKSALDRALELPVVQVV